MSPSRAARSAGSTFVLVTAALALALILSAGAAWGLPKYGAETGQDCDYCHLSPGRDLTSQGRAFRDNGFRLVEEPGVPGGEGEPGGEAAPPAVDRTETILTFPEWARVFLRGAHILAAVLWLGAVVSVFIVQRTQIADTGIPSAYLKLAWPGIIAVGLSGLLLTGDAVTGAEGLTGNRWGQVLLAKMALYLLFVVVAGTATLVVSPRIRTLAEEPRHGLSLENYKAQGRVVVQYRGRVYEVTGSRLWPEGRHARRHDAWHDLTASLEKAPHGTEVFERFRMIEEAGEEEAPPLRRLFVVMMGSSTALALAIVLLLALW
jgi:predicted heme/steroid binding protein/uncharacterized membrane protein